MNTENNELQPYTQIIYVPNHAKGSTTHPACEKGFVQRDEGTRVLCRFFYSDGRLRTRANGEWCDRNNVVAEDHMPQARILQFVRELFGETQP